MLLLLLISIGMFITAARGIRRKPPPTSRPPGAPGKLQSIITVANDVLRKLSNVGKDLSVFSRETVQMFHDDATAAGYTIDTAETNAAE